MSNNIQWSFQEQYLWKSIPNNNGYGTKYPSCSGVEQSPINIDTDIILQCKSLCQLKTMFKNSKCKVKYNNSLLTFKMSSGSFIEYKGSIYELSEISVHTPSLHTIDGESFDMEILLIHRISEKSEENKISNSNDNGVIISCLYQRGAHHGGPERFFNEVINELPAENISYNKSIEVSKDWGPNLLLPEKKGFYSYIGSLPYPPCAEKFTYIVMEEIGYIGSSTLNILKINLGDNIRKIQQSNNREIFYNNGDNFELDLTQQSDNNNKYLKCTKVDRIKKMKIKIPVIDYSKNGYDGDNGLSEPFKRKIMGLILFITTIIMFLCAYKFVKFLYTDKLKDPKNPSKGTTPGILKRFFTNMNVSYVSGSEYESKWHDGKNVSGKNVCSN